MDSMALVLSWAARLGDWPIFLGSAQPLSIAATKACAARELSAVSDWKFPVTRTTQRTLLANATNSELADYP